MYLRKSFLPRHFEFPFVDLEVSLTDFLAGNFVHHTDSADTLFLLLAISLLWGSQIEL
jgi:hypothetical protein